MKTVVLIKGMMCKMCEKHVENAIKDAFDVKKVKAAHEDGTAVIVSKSSLDKASLKKTVEDIGYSVTNISEI